MSDSPAIRSLQTAGIAAFVIIVAACSAMPSGTTQPTVGPTVATPATSSAPATAIPSAGATATATATATRSAQASAESLVYPVAEGEEWILFDAPADDPGEPGPHDALFLVRPDGSGLHRLVHQMIGSELRATWSPDGSQVAYIQTRWPLDNGPEGGIYVVNADGSDAHRVFQCASWCNSMDYLDWGPDGAIYVGIDSNVPAPDLSPLTFEIWRVDPTTGEGRAVLTREDEMTVEQPRISPDATQLVYARERIADGKWAIFVADAEGGPEQRLTDWDIYAAYPDWSVNDVISFNTNDLRLRNEQSHEVYTVGADGRRLRQIKTHDPAAPDVAAQAAHARWARDGRVLTFSLLLRGEPYLAMMGPDGSDQRLVPGPIAGTFSEMRPTAD